MIKLFDSYKMGDYVVCLSWILFILVLQSVHYASPEVVLVQLSSGDTIGGAIYKGALIPDGLTVESTPLKETRNVRELVYDSQVEQVYWIDAEKKTINAAFTDGSNFRTLHTLSPDSEPNCLALDPSARLLYYADSGENVIGVINVEGSYHHTLFYNLDKPSHLAVDARNGFVYWVMSGSSPGIYKGPTCGSRKDPVITENVPQISGLALDMKANKLFWSDASTGKLEESTTDGTGRKVLWEEPGLSPTGLTIGEDGLYFVDKKTRDLYRFREASTGSLVEEKRFLRSLRTGLRKREAGQENATDIIPPDAKPNQPAEADAKKPVLAPLDDPVKVPAAPAEATTRAAVPPEENPAQAQDTPENRTANATEAKVKEPVELAPPAAKTTQPPMTTRSPLKVKDIAPEGEKVPAPVDAGPAREVGIPGDDVAAAANTSLKESAKPEAPQREAAPGGEAPIAPTQAKPVDGIPKLQAPEFAAVPEVKVVPPTTLPPTTTKPTTVTTTTTPTTTKTTTTTNTTTTAPPAPLQKVKVMGLEQQTIINMWPSIVRQEPGICSQDNGQCSHLCFPHPVKGHLCACPDGMTMEKEKNTCTHQARYDPKKSYLIFTHTSRGESQQGSVCTMDLSSGNINCRRPTSSTYGPIEFNAEGARAYWVDETKQAVMSSKYDGKWARTLFRISKESTVTDLKVNGITQLLYLADSTKNEIIEADMTHPYAERVIKTNLEHPQSIVVGKELYWSEWGKVPKILKAELSPGKLGTSEVVLEKDLGQPMALQMDYKDFSLYWVDSAASKVERLSLKTKERTTIYQEKNARFRGLALDDTYLYVTDWNSGFIKRIEKTGDHKMAKIGRVLLGQLNHVLLYKHTVYDKESGYGECGELTPTEASEPKCYRQGTLMYCRAGCKEGFEHLPSRFEDHEKLYICMEGKWAPSEPLPQCFETIEGKGASVRGQLTFTTTKANCSSSNYTETMGEKARMIMLSNHYKMCSVQRCVLKDPRVTCFPTGPTVGGEGPAKVTVDVIWRVMKSPNDTVAELKEHLSKEMYHLVRTHMSVVVNDVTIPVNLGETFFGRPMAACDTGEEMTFEGCVACNKGSYYDQYSARCTKCPMHTFQDEPAKQKCKPCPDRTFGNITGAFNQSQCLDLDMNVGKDIPFGVFPNDVNITSSRANRQGGVVSESKCSRNGNVCTRYMTYNMKLAHLIVGIVICVVFFLIFLIILLILVRKRRRRTKQEAREKWAGDHIRRSMSDILKSSQLENGDALHPEDGSPPLSEGRHEMDDVSIAPLAEEEDTFLGVSTPNLLV